MKKFNLSYQLFYIGLLLLPIVMSSRQISQRRKDFPTLFYPGANRQLVTLAPHEVPVSTSSPVNNNNIDQQDQILTAQQNTNQQNLRIKNFQQIQVDNIEEPNQNLNQNQVQIVYIRPGSDQSSSLFDVVQGFQDKPLESQESQGGFRNVQDLRQNGNGQQLSVEARRRPHILSTNGNSPKALRPYPIRLRLQDLVSPPVQSQVEPTIQFHDTPQQVGNQVQQPQFVNPTFEEPRINEEQFQPQQVDFQQFETPEELIVPQEFEQNPNEFDQQNHQNQQNFNNQDINNNNNQFFQNQNEQFDQQQQFTDNQNQQQQFPVDLSPPIAQSQEFFPPQPTPFPQNQQFIPSPPPLPTQTPPPKLPRLPWNIPQRRPHALDIDDGSNQQFDPLFNNQQQQASNNFQQQFPQHPQQFIENENINNLSNEGFAGIQMVDNNQFNQDIGTTSIPLLNDNSLDSFFRSSKTNFSCKNQQFPGYYADIDAGCQMFHVCYAGSHFTFQCPPGTLFDQKYLVCNWPREVNCNLSPDFYNVNSIFVDDRYQSKK